MSRFIALLIAAVALAVLPSASASAVDPVVARDRVGDVKVTDLPGLSRADRRSIDVRSVGIRDVGRKVRFSVAIDEVVRTRRFDQMFFFELTPPPGAGDSWESSVALRSRGGRFGAYAVYLTPDRVENCTLRVQARTRTDLLFVDVPRRCLPRAAARIRLEAATGFFQTDAPVWSRDRLAIPGRH